MSSWDRNLRKYDEIRSNKFHQSKTYYELIENARDLANQKDNQNPLIALSIKKSNKFCESFIQDQKKELEYQLSQLSTSKAQNENELDEILKPISIGHRNSYLTRLTTKNETQSVVRKPPNISCYANYSLWSKRAALLEGYLRNYVKNDINDINETLYFYEKLQDNMSLNMIDILYSDEDDNGFRENIFRISSSTKQNAPCLFKESFQRREFDPLVLTIANDHITMQRFLRANRVLAFTESTIKPNNKDGDFKLDAVLLGTSLEGDIHIRPLCTSADFILALHEIQDPSVFHQGFITLPYFSESIIERNTDFFYRFNYNAKGRSSYQIIKSNLPTEHKELKVILSALSQYCPLSVETQSINESFVPQNFKEYCQSLIISINELFRPENNVLLTLSVDIEIFEKKMTINTNSSQENNCDYRISAFNNLKLTQIYASGRRNAIWDINSMNLNFLSEFNDFFHREWNSLVNNTQDMNISLHNLPPSHLKAYEYSRILFNKYFSKDDLKSKSKDLIDNFPLSSSSSLDYSSLEEREQENSDNILSPVTKGIKSLPLNEDLDINKTREKEHPPSRELLSNYHRKGSRFMKNKTIKINPPNKANQQQIFNESHPYRENYIDNSELSNQMKEASLQYIKLWSHCYENQYNFESDNIKTKLISSDDRLSKFNNNTVPYQFETVSQSKEFPSKEKQPIFKPTSKYAINCLKKAKNLLIHSNLSPNHIPLQILQDLLPYQDENDLIVENLFYQDELSSIAYQIAKDVDLIALMNRDGVIQYIDQVKASILKKNSLQREHILQKIEADEKKKEEIKQKYENEPELKIKEEQEKKLEQRDQLEKDSIDLLKEMISTVKQQDPQFSKALKKIIKFYLNRIKKRKEKQEEIKKKFEKRRQVSISKDQVKQLTQFYFTVPPQTFSSSSSDKDSNIDSEKGGYNKENGVHYDSSVDSDDLRPRDDFRISTPLRRSINFSPGRIRVSRSISNDESELKSPVESPRRSTLRRSINLSMNSFIIDGNILGQSKDEDDKHLSIENNKSKPIQIIDTPLIKEDSIDEIWENMTDTLSSMAESRMFEDPELPFQSTSNISRGGKLWNDDNKIKPSLDFIAELASESVSQTVADQSSNFPSESTPNLTGPHSKEIQENEIILEEKDDIESSDLPQTNFSVEQDEDLMSLLTKIRAGQERSLDPLLRSTSKSRASSFALVPEMLLQTPPNSKPPSRLSIHSRNGKLFPEFHERPRTNQSSTEKPKTPQLFGVVGNQLSKSGSEGSKTSNVFTPYQSNQNLPIAYFHNSDMELIDLNNTNHSSLVDQFISLGSPSLQEVPPEVPDTEISKDQLSVFFSNSDKNNTSDIIQTENINHERPESSLTQSNNRRLTVVSTNPGVPSIFPSNFITSSVNNRRMTTIKTTSDHSDLFISPKGVEKNNKFSFLRPRPPPSPGSTHRPSVSNRHVTFSISNDKKIDNI